VLGLTTNFSLARKKNTAKNTAARISADTDKLKFVTPNQSGVASFSLPTSAWVNGKLSLVTQKNAVKNAAMYQRRQ